MPKYEKIAIVGMGRSGSTVLYNLAKACLRRSGLKVFGALCSIPQASDEIKKAENDMDAVVLKTHAYSRFLHEWADAILTPKRDLRDALASTRRYMPHRATNPAEIIKECKGMTKAHDDWMPYADYRFVYEDYKRDPLVEIEKLANFLETRIGAQEVLEDMKDLHKKGYEDTICARNHITDGGVGTYGNTLTPSEVALIEEKFGWWLDREGYL